MRNRSVVELAEIGPDDLADVGGKALNLGRMITAGLPVPPAFCVTTDAYRRVVGDRLDDVIVALATVVDPGQVGRLAERARQIVLTAPVPRDLATVIIERYAALGSDTPVAVRSSATAEDLPGASFAGQQDTYLNVVGADAVLDATRRCWASLWTDRAVSYRRTQGIDHGEVNLAVVVQEMIDACVAGVMFTANPVTGSRAQLVIDASPGLGESVVSGTVNPDRFVVQTATGQVVEERLGDKRTAVWSVVGGGTETAILPGTAAPCLSRDQLVDLTAMARRVSQEYDSPQDTEWAIGADGSVWLTQARPITTLYPLPPFRPPADGVRVYWCGSLAQGLTRPITPMGQATFRLMGTSVATLAGRPPADRLAGPNGLVIAGERLFADITPLLRHRRARMVLNRILGVMEARTKSVLESLQHDPRFAAAPSDRKGQEALPIVVSLLARTKLPLRAAVGLASPAAALWATDRVEASVRNRWMIPADATPLERLAAVEERLRTDTFPIMPRVFGYAVAGLVSLAAARRLAGRQLDSALFDDVRRGLPHNVTTEMDLELWSLASRIRDDPDAAAVLTSTDSMALTEAFRRSTLPAVVQTGLARFLQRYGHRAVAEIDLGLPRWSDEPTHLLGMLANYLQLADAAMAPDRQFARGAEVGADAVATIISRTRRDGWSGPLRARLAALALDRARRLIGLRERPKSILVYALGAARRELQIVGDAAVAAGGIEAQDDIFFVDLPQARRALTGIDLRAEVRRRRGTYDLELRRRHIPRLLLSDGTEPETLLRVEVPEGALVGSPASVGSVTGRARVVLDPSGARLDPGEILVAPSTDPGWTPLFLTAGGLVMEMGGAMSHGAVVAREYGIPAVVGVPDATSRITTGQQVVVDGAAGTVRLG
ncbi:MAG: phosphoenolpyruvate synthase [Microlunatus sp.]|nr:phosphoenolpyruvate synthase [Microlunatus sp.]